MSTLRVAGNRRNHPALYSRDVRHESVEGLAADPKPRSGSFADAAGNRRGGLRRRSGRDRERHLPCHRQESESSADSNRSVYLRHETGSHRPTVFAHNRRIYLCSLEQPGCTVWIPILTCVMSSSACRSPRRARSASRSPGPGSSTAKQRTDRRCTPWLRITSSLLRPTSLSNLAKMQLRIRGWTLLVYSPRCTAVRIRIFLAQIIL
jgi:hypothetical protein